MSTTDKPIWNTGLVNNGKLEQVYELAVVKHGQWLRTEAYPHRIYCSECYATFIRNDKFLHLEDIPHGYCPNCGARMNSPCSNCQEFDCYGCEVKIDGENEEDGHTER